MVPPKVETMNQSLDVMWACHCRSCYSCDPLPEVLVDNLSYGANAVTYLSTQASMHSVRLLGVSCISNELCQNILMKIH